MFIWLNTQPLRRQIYALLRACIFCKDNVSGISSSVAQERRESAPKMKINPTALFKDL